MDTFYDNIGIILVVAIVAIYWLYKGYKWVAYKNKYPVLSSELPSGIMEVGDIVYFGDNKKVFRGISNTNGLWYEFMPDNSVTSEFIDRSDAIKRMDAVYGMYGLKWKKVK